MERRGRLIGAAFVGSAFLAGGNAVAIRFSNRELAPLWGAGLRFVLAALLLLMLMAALKLAFPRGRVLVGAMLYGVFQFGGAFGLAYVALVEMHAGLGQTLLALVPLATLVLAVAYRQERLHGAAVIGSVLGLIGVAVISTAPLQESMSTTALVAMLGSVLCFAQAAVLVRPIRSVHPVVMNTVAMFTGAAVLLAGSGLLGESHVLPSRMATWIALGYVVVIGSVVVFLLYVYVLQHWSASRASYVMVIIPFITVALSAWLDGERIGRGLVVGGLLVLAGVYFGALRRPSPALTPQARARTSSPSTSLPRNR